MSLPSNKNTPHPTNKYIIHQLKLAARNTPQTLTFAFFPMTHPRPTHTPSAARLILSHPYFLNLILSHLATPTRSNMHTLLACEAAHILFRITIGNSPTLLATLFRRAPPVPADFEGPFPLNPFVFEDPDGDEDGTRPVMGVVGRTYRLRPETGLRGSMTLEGPVENNPSGGAAAGDAPACVGRQDGQEHNTASTRSRELRITTQSLGEVKQEIRRRHDW